MEDGRLAYPFVSWKENYFEEALKLWDYDLTTVIIENAFIFECWQGGLSHDTLMNFGPVVRELYLHLAKKFNKMKNQKGSSSAPDSEYANT